MSSPESSPKSSPKGATHTGGCLCGAVRYTLHGEPLYAGLCYCGDCRKASGAGCIPFMGFPSSALCITGNTRQSISRSARGGEAVRNFCPQCGSLIFGGRLGSDEQHTVYAGSLDDPSWFHPTIAIFTRDRSAWAQLPTGLKTYDTLPG
jgi:hypothetical protein